MKKLVYITLLFLIVGATLNSAPTKPSENCISQDKLEQIIDNRKLQTLLQSNTTTGKIHEMMFTPLNNGELFIVEYDKSITDKDRKYCIVSITNNININEVSIDNLYNALERVRGHRA